MVRQPGGRSKRKHICIKAVNNDDDDGDAENADDDDDNEDNDDDDDGAWTLAVACLRTLTRTTPSSTAPTCPSCRKSSAAQTQKTWSSCRTKKKGMGMRLHRHLNLPQHTATGVPLRIPARLSEPP